MKNLPFWLAKKLTQGNGGTGKTGAVIAVLGVAFAVAVMEITLAVVVGFKHQITSKLEGFVAPITVGASIIDNTNRDAFIPLGPDLLEPIGKIVPQADIVPIVSQAGMLKTDDDFAAVLLKGYEDGYQAVFEKSNIVDGRWLNATDKRGIVISKHLSTTLGLNVGDRVNACFFLKDNVRTRPFDIVGIYESGLVEFDNLMAYTNAATLRGINKLPDNYVSAVELRGLSIDRSMQLSGQLAAEYIDRASMHSDPDIAYNVDSIDQQGSLYLNWLDLLDTNVVVIFILMTLVAASTLISALFIQVLEKVNAIGLLRALGARNRTVSRIFMYLSLRFVGGGMILGNVLGLGFVAVQSQWNLISLDPAMYYLNSVPVEISPLTVIVLNACVVVAAWLILILPARIATRLSPASTLRFD